MKQKLTAIACLATSLFLFSCKKEGTLQTTLSEKTSLSSVPADEEVNAAKETGQQVVTSVDADGYSKLILHPNDSNGQDTWVDYLEGGGYVNNNYGPIDQVKAMGWTTGGVPFYVRFFIRFDDLAKVPAGKSIALAKIYLQGLPGSPIHLPEGNSCYPGSPYGTGHNQMYVKRITSAWDEATVTWATQPTTTDDNEALTRASKKQWNDDLSIDVTSLVSDMVNKPSESFGFAFILKNEQPYNSWGFYSSEAEKVRDRPTLYVKYK